MRTCPRTFDRETRCNSAISGSRADSNLFHIEYSGRSRIHCSSFCCCHNGNSSWKTKRSETCPINRVYSYIQIWWSTVTHFLSNIKHGSLILFTFANHYNTMHIDTIQCKSHSVYSGLVDRNFIALAHPTTGA